MPSICCNGASSFPADSQKERNGINGQTNGMVIGPEMCYFCFDVLYSHLNNTETPKNPNFTNDP